MSAQHRSTPRRNAFWYWLLIPLVVALVQTVLSIQAAEPLAYSDFKRLLRAGKVEELVISDNAIKGMAVVAGVEQLLRAIGGARRTDQPSAPDGRRRGRPARFTPAGVAGARCPRRRVAPLARRARCARRLVPPV